jgi:tRNA A37 threonylcarbamoyltransferase TsaD
LPLQFRGISMARGEFIRLRWSALYVSGHHASKVAVAATGESRCEGGTWDALWILRLPS